MRSRTELAATFRQPVGGREERFVAPEAADLDGSFLAPVGTDRDSLAGLDKRAVGASSNKVAPDTGHDEIVRVVVMGIPVEVVRDDRVASSPTLHPHKVTTAPVARLRPRSDLLVEDESMLLDRAITGREWMVGALDVLVPAHGYIVTAEGPE